METSSQRFQQAVGFLNRAINGGNRGVRSITHTTDFIAIIASLEQNQNVARLVARAADEPVIFSHRYIILESEKKTIEKTFVKSIR